MASCAVETAGPTLLEKIESFLNDSQYRETVESSVNYNTRLCIERRLRMPFLDSQTGVAQNHSNLFMAARHRLPGFLQGQIYTYPSKRWRKKRRQYLSSFLQPRRGTVMPPKEAGDEAGEHFHTISTVENPAAVSVGNDEASKDSLKEDPKDWYINEDDMFDMEGFDEPDPDSDYDYEESYRKKKKRSSKPARGSSSNDSPHNKKAKPAGRGRQKKNPTVYPDPSDPEKPFGCDICGARYKTRPGLTYHFTHSHKNKDLDEDDSSTGPIGGGPMGAMGGQSPGGPGGSMGHGPSGGVGGPPGGAGSMPGDMASGSATGHGNGDSLKSPDGQAPGQAAGHNQAAGWSKFQDSYLTFLKSPEGSPKKAKGASGTKPTPSSAGHSRPTTPAGEDSDPNSEMRKMMMGGPLEGGLSFEDRRPKANPSPYCDFCLGDASENKKSGAPEVLVSCADCGRSGHPSCLQFTANMIISYRKYRWQCIECKCCSICGNSDNDDQLLFCDDCDRGYHMYCLSPPLTSPPEGSWSCRLCLAEFHSK
ncbi:zinc finger protein ubi-d4 B-like [Thrips palmi]|uniref:Zinc finger protein ubi-d4 B-like n=1 Tax=Thrips palmi TaxID=161013 RepID=A0A6P8YMW7_THRPL|nr:zinc finger protein ubi-d4 B-like [Thrips palmi]